MREPENWKAPETDVGDEEPPGERAEGAGPKLIVLTILWAVSLVCWVSAGGVTWLFGSVFAVLTIAIITSLGEWFEVSPRAARGVRSLTRIALGVILVMALLAVTFILIDMSGR